MTGYRPIDISIIVNHKVRLKVEEPLDKGEYQRMVGKLIYLAHTSLDIAYAISVVSQFMYATLKLPLEAVYRILRYLKGLAGGLLFLKGRRN